MEELNIFYLMPIKVRNEFPYFFLLWVIAFFAGKVALQLSNLHLYLHRQFVCTA